MIRVTPYPKKRFAAVLTAFGLIAALLIALRPAPAQQQLGLDNSDEARRTLDEAQAQGDSARKRAEQLEASASSAAAAADRTAQEAAAVAARIQQSEADIAANQARIILIERQRQVLRAQLAQRQEPVVRLTAALQRLSRRPAVLSLLRPGSLEDTVYLRAVLETMLPEVERRTAGLRGELARARTLQAQARQATDALRQSESELTQRRAALSALESQQRIASRQAGGIADRETERALALSEQARDLTQLIDTLDKAGELRAQLAALPGPVMRPALPQAAQVTSDAIAPTPPAAVPPRYILPLAGRLVAGFGDVTPGQPRSRGLSLAARAGAQVIAPGAGRVIFAGPYQGYGNIVIIEHPGGWTSLVTGLALLDIKVGQQLIAGSPLGTVGPGRPVVALELRHAGEPVNPLDYLKG